jgi:hypothetical protein
VTSQGVPGLAFAPAPDAILTAQEVAAWLKITPRQVQRLGVPCIDLGRKTKRYLAKDVSEYLEARRQLDGRCEG